MSELFWSCAAGASMAALLGVWAKYRIYLYHADATSLTAALWRKGAVR